MVRPGHIGNRSFRTHRLHFWAKRVVQRLQGSFLQVDVAQIIIHKTDQPDPFFDFLETNGLTGEYRAEIHFLAVQADASAAGDLDGRVMEGIGQFRQAAIGAQGRSINFRGALHVQSLVRPFVVELPEKLVEFALLLQAVHSRRSSGFVFERETHALMPAVLLRMTGLDAFDDDAQTQPPHGKFGEIEQRVGRGEGHTVVGADAVRQAALPRAAGIGNWKAPRAIAMVSAAKSKSLRRLEKFSTTTLRQQLDTQVRPISESTLDWVQLALFAKLRFAGQADTRSF
jgi:hypothetical protein